MPERSDRDAARADLTGRRAGSEDRALDLAGDVVGPEGELMVHRDDAIKLSDGVDEFGDLGATRHLTGQAHHALPDLDRQLRRIEQQPDRNDVLCDLAPDAGIVAQIGP